MIARNIGSNQDSWFHLVVAAIARGLAALIHQDDRRL